MPLKISVRDTCSDVVGVGECFRLEAGVSIKLVLRAHPMVADLISYEVHPMQQSKC